MNVDPAQHHRQLWRLVRNRCNQAQAQRGGICWNCVRWWLRWMAGDLPPLDEMGAR